MNEKLENTPDDQIVESELLYTKLSEFSQLLGTKDEDGNYRLLKENNGLSTWDTLDVIMLSNLLMAIMSAGREGMLLCQQYLLVIADLLFERAKGIRADEYLEAFKKEYINTKMDALSLDEMKDWQKEWIEEMVTRHEE
jgi:hypothetical protein